MKISSNDANNIYKKKKIKDLVAGDFLLHPIYRSDGLMLITKNKVLSSSLINIIKKHADLSSSVLIISDKDMLNEISEKDLFSTPAFIEDLEEVVHHFNSNANIQTSIAAYMHEDALGLSRELDNNFYANLLSNYPMWYSLGQKLESKQLKLRSDRVKKRLLNYIIDDDTFNNLFQSFKSYDDILFLHSINTTCISLMIGLTLELNDDELIDLAIAALFANIGFLDISKTDFKDFLKNSTINHEIIIKHLEMFSKMTFTSPYLRKEAIIYGILDHHEHYNGQGFPHGKKGEDISLYGRILNLAQSYDELVGGYKYTNGLSPMESLKLIYENKENIYDQNILNAFIHRTTYFKLEETIILANGIKGTIIGFENFLKYPNLPMVVLENGQVLNLHKD